MPRVALKSRENVSVNFQLESERIFDATMDVVASDCVVQYFQLESERIFDATPAARRELACVPPFQLESERIFDATHHRLRRSSRPYSSSSWSRNGSSMPHAAANQATKDAKSFQLESERIFDATRP